MGEEEDGSIQVAVRVPKVWLPRLDRIAAALSRDGLTVLRSQAHRAALARGLNAFEAELFGESEVSKK